MLITSSDNFNKSITVSSISSLVAEPLQATNDLYVLSIKVALDGKLVLCDILYSPNYSSIFAGTDG